MNDEEKNNIKALLKKISQLSENISEKPTFMEISGYPHYENVCSNILKFFLQPDNEHGIDDLVLSSLLNVYKEKLKHPDVMKKFDDVYKEKVKDLNISNVDVEREVPTKQGKRLDIVIDTDEFIMGIENKIYADLNNPLEEYTAYLQSAIDKEKIIIKILLGLTINKNNIDECIEAGFVPIIYTELFKEIRKNIGDHVQEADTKYFTYLMDFMTSIENLMKGSTMDKNEFDIIKNNEDHVKRIISMVTDLKNELRRKVCVIGNALKEDDGFKDNSNIFVSYYREGKELFDIVYVNIKINDVFTFAIDIVLRTSGWEIQCFPRRKEYIKRVEEILTEKGIEYIINNKRCILNMNFKYNDQLNKIIESIINLINKVSEYCL